MREVVQLLLGDNIQTAKKHLPLHLDEIKTIAEEVRLKVLLWKPSK